MLVIKICIVLILLEVRVFIIIMDIKVKYCGYLGEGDWMIMVEEDEIRFRGFGG